MKTNSTLQKLEKQFTLKEKLFGDLFKVRDDFKEVSFKDKAVFEIASWIPGLNFFNTGFNGTQLLAETERISKTNAEVIRRSLMSFGKVILTNFLLPPYIISGIYSGCWTPTQYKERNHQRIENSYIQAGADYNANGKIETWEKLKFFDENGLENSIDSILFNGSFRANSREIEQAVNNYKSLQNENEGIEDGKYENK